MVDIHCHLLPGLDDGPDTLEESLEMTEMAVADGITHIVATPHANDRFRFDPEVNARRREEITARFGSRLEVGTGCDFHLSYENLEDARAHPRKYTINQNRYLLVEFANFSIPPSMDQTLHELQLLGMVPIITHPERNGLLRGDPERMVEWVRRGCYVQVTAQSLLGRFGEAAQHWAEAWLEQDLVHFVASDAHNAGSRPPQLREVFEMVKAKRGDQIALALFRENPLAAFEGRPLPYVPEPPDAGSVKPPRRKKRFRFF